MAEGASMAASIYPDDVVKRVLSALAALDVLEFIDYRPDSLVREGGKVRCFCPIHRDTTFQSLVVDLNAKTFKCSRDDCPGTEGGDIVALAAWAVRTDYDTVLRRLVEEYAIKVVLPENPEAVNEALVEADNFASLAVASPTNRDEHRRDARERVDRVLAEDPENLLALRILKRLLDAEDPKGELAAVVGRLADAELAAGNRDGFSRLLQKHLARDEGNLVLRKRLADFFAENNERDRAIEQYMIVADQAEVAGRFDAAIEAYRRLEAMGDTGIDAGAMISQLLVLLDRNKDAARQLAERAVYHIGRGESDQAVDLLERALEIDPLHGAAARAMLDVQIARGIEREEFMAAMRRVDGMMGKTLWSDAIAVLEGLAAAMPDDANVVERLYACHARARNAPMALAMQERLVTLYLKEGDRAAARTVLEDMLAARPDDVEALRRSVELALLDGDNESVIARGRSLAQVCERNGDAEGAVDAYRRMTAAAPDSTRVALEFADLLKRLDRRAEAVEVLGATIAVLREERNLLGLKDVLLEGLRLAPDHPDFLLAYAWTLETLGEGDKALEKRLAACRAMIRAGHASSAEEELKRVLEANPKLAAARELLAEALAARGKKDDAVRELSDLAASLADAKRFARARDTLERLVDLDPYNVDALARLAEACESIGEADAIATARERLLHVQRARQMHPDAAANARRMIELRPDRVDVHRELLDALKLAGDAEGWANAARVFARLLGESGDAPGERDTLAEIVARRPRDFEARERLLVVQRGVDGDSDALAAEIDAYAALCEQEGEIERGAEFLRSFRGQSSDSGIIGRRLVDLFQKASRTEQQEEELLALARRHEERGENAELVPLYRELLKLKPSDAALHRRLVATLLNLGRRDEAAEAAANLAELHARQHRYDDGEEAFREVLEIDPASERAWRGLASLHRERGGAEDAIAALRELALLRSERGDFDGAEAILREGFEIDADSPAVQREIANLWLAPRHLDGDRAARELETLADFHAARGGDDEAVAARREAIGLRPMDVDVRRRLAQFLLERGRRAAAVDELLAVGDAHLALEEHEAAFLVAEECLEISPGSLAARALRARVLEESGDAAGALREWREMAPEIARRPDTPVDDAPPRETPRLQVVREYDFDRFVVGERNRFAHATALAVARAPGRTPHNPLFLHSDVGLGKTHLLHAIANAVAASSPEARVIYTNAEDFTSELVDAIGANAVGAFRAKYKSVDMLLLDDVHFLAGKETAQEEFFHIFNALFQARRQIVVTSDRPPRDIARLEKRLKSRFGAGVIVDIHAPEVETRLAILRRGAAERSDLRIPDDALALIAERVETNVRELKAALNQLVLHHEVGGEPLERETADRVLRKLAAAL